MFYINTSKHQNLLSFRARFSEFLGGYEYVLSKVLIFFTPHAAHAVGAVGGAHAVHAFFLGPVVNTSKITLDVIKISPDFT
jgi:hypothetical protein